jgi:hypothetical protein
MPKPIQNTMKIKFFQNCVDSDGAVENNSNSAGNIPMNTTVCKANTVTKT